MSAIFFCAPSVAAQSLPPALQACLTQKDDVQRLQCYDREVSQLSAAKESTAAGVTKDSKAQSPATPESKFGYRGTVAREELDRKEAEEPKEITGMIASLATRTRGEYVITLENGQIWNQKSVDGSIDLKVGDQVTLKRGALGAVWLITPKGRSTQVTRTR